MSLSFTQRFKRLPEAGASPVFLWDKVWQLENGTSLEQIKIESMTCDDSGFVLYDMMRRGRLPPQNAESRQNLSPASPCLCGSGPNRVKLKDYVKLAGKLRATQGKDPKEERTAVVRITDLFAFPVRSYQIW